MRIVRSGHLVLMLLVACCATAADGNSVQGVQVGDIDRKADPCTDFFEFANGRWRAENPIPRVDAALEPALGRRRGDQGTAARDPRAGRRHEGAARQHRAADRRFLRRLHERERRPNSLGAKPIAPLLAQIDAIRSAADLQKTIGELHAMRDRRAVRRVSAIRTCTTRRS